MRLLHTCSQNHEAKAARGTADSQRRSGRVRTRCLTKALLSDTTQHLVDAQQHPALKRAAGNSEQLKALYEGLVKVHSTVAEATGLQRTPTKVSEDGATTYGTADGSTIIQFLVHKGGKVDWMTTACSSLAKIGGGLARATAFADSTTEAPHLNYELGYTFGNITLYLNLTARVNLLVDEEYFQKYYQRRGEGGFSINDLELQLQGDADFTPFRSKSPDVRMLAGQTALLYSAEGSLDNVKKAIELGQKVTELWLEFVNDPATAVRESKKAEIAAHDTALFPFPRKDPGNAIIVGLLGADKTEEILKLSCKDPSILL